MILQQIYTYIKRKRRAIL